MSVRPAEVISLIRVMRRAPRDRHDAFALGEEPGQARTSWEMVGSLTRAGLILHNEMIVPHGESAAERAGPA